ncbi:hypothetical protein TNCV_91821 [Trichonephila clavipes]|nr:hypothetical protein TNCV_91821 [Trichonephila clavipes]
MSLNDYFAANGAVYLRPVGMPDCFPLPGGPRGCPQAGEQIRIIPSSSSLRKASFSKDPQSAAAYVNRRPRFMATHQLDFVAMGSGCHDNPTLLPSPPPSLRVISPAQ